MLMIKDLIKSVGLKATPQRIAIYESMRKLGHACADMVVEDLREKYPTLTVATIYNVLESFVEAGLLVKRFSLNHKMYFDVNTYEHAHCYDTVHNHFIDIDDPELLKLVTDYISSKEIEHFEVEGIDIHITGKQK
ncbi:MAG: transcriptional repressor [Bacteroidales bacterium]|nr:transcriptional repressor [Bacteroidales bacterium]